MGEYFSIVCHRCRQRFWIGKPREAAWNQEASFKLGLFCIAHPAHPLEFRGDEYNYDPGYKIHRYRRIYDVRVDEHGYVELLDCAPDCKPPETQPEQPTPTPSSTPEIGTGPDNSTGTDGGTFQNIETSDADPGNAKPLPKQNLTDNAEGNAGGLDCISDCKGGQK